MTMKLPAGFRFQPTDEELISFYLLRKVRGEELDWDGIRESEIYGEKAPWQICDDLCDQEKLYVFTRLKKLSKNRVARSAGCGVWHENSSDKIYDNQGDVIGARKLFCFRVKEGSCMKKSNWIMHEFSLVGEQERTTNWVLCTIQKKGSDQSRAGIKRCRLQDQSCSTVIPVEIETPQPWINTDVLLLEDETQKRKRMRCDDVECDATETPSSECPSEFGTPDQSEFTPSQDSDLETQMDMGCLPGSDNSDSEFGISFTDLEAFMNCLPTASNDDSESEFHASYGYLPPHPSPEGGHLPLGTWVDFCDVEFGTLLA